MKARILSAVGTPLDANGNLVVDSYKKQIEDQIKAGVIGILSMGSMGQQAFIRTEECRKVAQAAIEATAGRVPVYVGAMDCSISRAKERLAAMEDLDVAAFVFTAPYYSPSNAPQMLNYFKSVAAATKHPVMLYDLPSVTQSKITYEMVMTLIREVPNLIGIKSNDMKMFRKLKLNPEVPKDFIMVYSGLDTFDIAYKWGIDRCLDGMMGCTPANTCKLFTALAEGDYDAAAIYLDNIVSLRDFFAAHDLWPCFSTAMNMLGYEGNFAPDYILPVKEEYIPLVWAEMVRVGELAE